VVYLKALTGLLWGPGWSKSRHDWSIWKAIFMRYATSLLRRFRYNICHSKV